MIAMYGYKVATNNGENMSASIQQDQSYTFTWDNKDLDAVVAALEELLMFVKPYRESWGTPAVDFNIKNGEATVKIKGDKIQVHPQGTSEVE